MIKKIILLAIAALATALFTTTATVLAQAGGTSCGETQTQYISCDSETGVAAINDLIRIAVIVLSTLIGIVAVGGLVYAAVLYASARDSQSQIGDAITIIRNIVIGLLLYGFTLAIMNWLMPGSVIG